jgi:hypothetical protein
MGPLTVGKHVWASEPTMAHQGVPLLVTGREQVAGRGPGGGCYMGIAGQLHGRWTGQWIVGEDSGGEAERGMVSRVVVDSLEVEGRLKCSCLRKWRPICS